MLRKFICGCDMPTLESLRANPDLSTFDSIVYDAEGFLTCVAHGARRYGWRSTGKTWPFSELAYERLVVFMEYPTEPKTNITLGKDKRDIRDPAVVGAVRMTEVRPRRIKDNPQA